MLEIVFVVPWRRVWLVQLLLLWYAVVILVLVLARRDARAPFTSGWFAIERWSHAGAEGCIDGTGAGEVGEVPPSAAVAGKSADATTAEAVVEPALG